MDVLDTLSECRQELDAIAVTGPGDWDRVNKGWAAKWRPWIRATFPDSIADFEQPIKAPSWAFVPPNAEVHPREGMFGIYRGYSPEEAAHRNRELDAGEPASHSEAQNCRALPRTPS